MLQRLSDTLVSNGVPDYRGDSHLLGAGSSPPWGGQPWLRRLRGISFAPQVGSIFNQALWDNTAKRWNGLDVQWTTESDATNRHRYQVTGKSLDAAGCTASRCW